MVFGLLPKLGLHMHIRYFSNFGFHNNIQIFYRCISFCKIADLHNSAKAWIPIINVILRKDAYAVDNYTWDINWISQVFNLSKNLWAEIKGRANADSTIGDSIIVNLTSICHSCFWRLRIRWHLFLSGWSIHQATGHLLHGQHNLHRLRGFSILSARV